MRCIPSCDTFLILLFHPIEIHPGVSTARRLHTQGPGLQDPALPSGQSKAENQITRHQLLHPHISTLQQASFSSYYPLYHGPLWDANCPAATWFRQKAVPISVSATGEFGIRVCLMSDLRRIPSHTPIAMRIPCDQRFPILSRVESRSSSQSLLRSV